MNEPDDPRDEEREVLDEEVAPDVDDADEDLADSSETAAFDNDRIPEPEHRTYETDAHQRRHESNRSTRRNGFESLLRDSFKKAVEIGLEAGIGTLKSADTVVRNVVDEVKVPREVTNYLFSQIDETKNVMIRAVASEVREFLDATDVASELQRALTALSFEVKMEIRFIPNEAGELQTKVKARATPKASRRDSKRPSARRRDDETEE